MESFKVLLVVAVAVLAIVGSNVAIPPAGKDQSVTIGDGISGCWDTLQHTEIVDVPASKSKVNIKEISFPPNSTAQKEILSGIKVKDQLRTGKNANVKVISGGVEQKFAKLRFTSRRNQPIRYVVEFYVRDDQSV